MKTWCERQGQVEVGVIEHEGQTFAALGASVQGRHVTGYLKTTSGEASLTTWCGLTMLACRSETIETYRDGATILLFRLTQGRFVVGYSLGEGMLFRGELLTDFTDDEARRIARRITDYFAELDAQDEFEASHPDEGSLLDIQYRCPECGHEWEETYECACDSECQHCGTENVTALDWKEHQG